MRARQICQHLINSAYRMLAFRVSECQNQHATLETVFLVFVFEICDKVFNLLRGHEEPTRGCRHLTLLGFPMCNRGFCRVLGIGNTRFTTLNQSVKAGAPVPPLDGRRRPKQGLAPLNHKRSLVFDFLNNLYLTAGETIPDGGHTSSNKRPRQGAHKFDGKLDKSKLRHLPPGKFADYYRLCTSENPVAQISHKLFLSVGVSVLWERQAS